jgi:hypothetical protein
MQVFRSYKGVKGAIVALLLAKRDVNIKVHRLPKVVFNHSLANILP